MTRHILEPVEFKHLLYGRRDTVATITINRPDNRNALGTDTVKELRQAFDQAKHDAAVRVIILTGAGKVFCAGADLQGFRLELSELDRYFQRRNLADLFLEMTELGKPTIARVNGHALASGFGLALTDAMDATFPGSRGMSGAIDASRSSSCTASSATSPDARVVRYHATGPACRFDH